MRFRNLSHQINKLSHQKGRTLQTGESVLIYHPFYEDRFKWSVRGIIHKVAQHATDCWEVLVDGVVRKVWYREWLFPATEGKGFDST